LLRLRSPVRPGALVLYPPSGVVVGLITRRSEVRVLSLLDRPPFLEKVAYFFLSVIKIENRKAMAINTAPTMKEILMA